MFVFGTSFTTKSPRACVNGLWNESDRESRHFNKNTQNK